MQREALEYLRKYGLDVEKDIAGVMLIALDAFNTLGLDLESALRDVGRLEHLVKYGGELQKAFAESALLTFIRICLCKDIDASSKKDFEAYLKKHNTEEHVLILSNILSPIASKFPWISNTSPMQDLGMMAIDS